MFVAHNVQQATAQTIFIPTMLSQKLLQGPHGHSRQQSDGLDALSIQIGELPANISGEMRPSVASAEAIVETVQEFLQSMLQTLQLLDVHVQPFEQATNRCSTAKTPVSPIQPVWYNYS